MTPEFWQTRWQNNQIGFHQSQVEPLLIEHFSALHIPKGSRILVPLCGKSMDMMWLAAQGYEVFGIELSEVAAQTFFTENQLLYTTTKHPDNPNISYYQGQAAMQKITIVVADIFALSAEDIASIDAVYDKAALIALPADMRPRYTEQVRTLSGNAPQLLLTFYYDPSQRDNKPPFAISEEQIEQYYKPYYTITQLAGQPASMRSAPDLMVTEYVWRLAHSSTSTSEKGSY